jgi:hypothetical protein
VSSFACSQRARSLHARATVARYFLQCLDCNRSLLSHVSSFICSQLVKSLHARATVARSFLQCLDCHRLLLSHVSSSICSQLVRSLHARATVARCCPAMCGKHTQHLAQMAACHMPAAGRCGCGSSSNSSSSSSSRSLRAAAQPCQASTRSIQLRWARDAS